MRTTSQKEVEAVLRLDAPTRFQHFIKRVVDEERAWGLWQGGWSLMTDEHGLALPLWPAREYAELCRLEEWGDHEPSKIQLEDLLGELLPKLQQRGIRAVVFPTPGGKGVVLGCAELSGTLHEEMERY